MNNTCWKDISDLDMKKEGVYLVYAPDDEYGKPYLSGNFALMRIAKISNGFMILIDGKFDFDTAKPTKYSIIDHIFEEII
jgi:hypothetical protein